MTTQPAAEPLSRGTAAFLAETQVLFVRSLRKLMRRPIALYFSLVQPVAWLVLFGQLFNQIARFPDAHDAFGGKSYFQFFIPAVMVQMILFGASQSGIGLLNDLESGFLSKLLTTPVHRMAILLGRILGDLARMALQGLIVIVIAYLVGLFQEQPVHYDYGLVGVLGALGLMLLFGLALAGFHVFVALKTRNTESAFLIANSLTLPLLFTSSAQLPLPLLPGWLQHVARFNPVTYAVDSMRLLLNGPAAVAGEQPGTLILRALAILGPLAAVTLTLAVHSFRRTVR